MEKASRIRTYPRYERRNIADCISNYVHNNRHFYVQPRSKMSLIDFGDRIQLSKDDEETIKKLIFITKDTYPFKMFQNCYIADCLYYHMKYDNNFNINDFQIDSLHRLSKFVCLENRFELWKLLRISFNDGIIFIPNQIRNFTECNHISLLETYFLAFLNLKACNDIISFDELLKSFGYSSIKQVIDDASNNHNSLSLIQKMIEAYQNIVEIEIVDSDVKI